MHVLLASVFFLAPLIAVAAPASKIQPQVAFQQSLAEFRKSPSDASREKLITLAARLKPAPTIPKEARRSFVMAGTFQKTAKSPEDFNAAVKAYEEALAVAPWWGDAYFNLSVSLESAGRYSDAKKALRHYLLGKPADAEQAEDRLYALEAKESIAAKERMKKAKTLIVPGASVGEVRVGMTDAEAVAVLGAATNRFDYDNNNGYRGVSLTWGVRPETIFMDFYKYQPAEVITTGQSRFVTSEGVGPGMPFTQALALLGPPTKSKDYGSNVETCYARGIILGRYAGSTKVDYVAVFLPASISKRCPD